MINGKGLSVRKPFYYFSILLHILDREEEETSRSTSSSNSY